MKKDTHITEVIFRMFNGEVLALFPYEIGTLEFDSVGSYMHIGQHSSADYSHCISDSRPATEEEYKDLNKELENIGYNLKQVKRRNYDRYSATYHTFKKKMYELE